MRRVSVWEGADDARMPPNLAVQSPDGVVRADALPMLHGEPRARQRLRAAFAYHLGGLFKPYRLQIVGDMQRFLLTHLEGPLGVYRLEFSCTILRFDFGTLANTLRQKWTVHR